MTARETVNALASDHFASREEAATAAQEALRFRNEADRESRRAEMARERSLDAAGQLGRILIAIAHIGEGVTIAPTMHHRDTRLSTPFAEASVYARHTGRGDPLIVEVRVNENRHQPGIYRSPDGPALSYTKGTTNPAKLDAQYDEALGAAHLWLQAYTAEAVLEAAGIDPADCPPVSELVKLDVTIEDRRSGFSPAGRRYWQPKWILTCSGVEVASLSDLWRISDAEHAGEDHEAQRIARTKIFETMPSGPDLHVSPEDLESALKAYQNEVIQWGWQHADTAEQLLLQAAGLAERKEAA